MKALATDAAQRYQSAGFLLEALESFAVSSRMSLSTMGLGRFMRDMFGEVQEPWLNTAATKVLQPIAAKESTISSTDGRGSKSQPIIAAGGHPVGDSSGVPDDEARFPDSNGINSAAKTTLDLPREDREPDEHLPSMEWNAKSYPASRPSAEAIPDPGMRQSYPSMTPVPTRASHPNVVQARQSQPQMPVDMRSGTPAGIQPMMHPPAGTTPPPELPLPPPPQHQFNVPGSGSHQSHPSHPAIVGIPSTKHGYTSGAMSRSGGSDVSYPRYEVPPEAMTGDVQLTPNRRPLFIGIGIVAVGLVVILAVSLSGGGNDTQPAAAPTDETEEAVAESASPPPAPEIEVLDDNMVSVVIQSDPIGADVLIAGTKIGVTPFDKKLKRGTKVAPLTIQKQGYAPINTKIDLGGDYENKRIKLTRLEDLEQGSDADPNNKDPKATDPKGTDKTDAKGTEKTDAKGTEKTDAKGTEKTDAKGTEKTGTRTEKAGAQVDKAGTRVEKTRVEKASTRAEKKEPEKKEPEKKEKCQPPGANLDPFGPPVCKT
jgi:hypothetical protein